MTTATDIITDAFALLGVYAPGETISAADMQQAFTTFNDMLDYLSNQSLAMYANADMSFPLVINQGQYTIGSGGQLNQLRPMEILKNPGSAYIVDNLQNVYPITVIDQFAWNQISTRNVTSNYPEQLFYDPQYPLGIINLWPTPSVNWTLHFTARLSFTDAANYVSTISLPPGYNLMLKRNLAKWLLDYFGSQVTPQDQAKIIANARETLATIKRQNTKIPIAVYDKTLSTKGGSTPYNVYTDNR